MEPWFDIAKCLEEKLTAAAAKSGLAVDDFVPDVRQADPRFGDFQANGVLPWAKRHRLNPRESAQKLVAVLPEFLGENADLISIDIAGPGFINFTLSPAFLLAWLQRYREEDDLKTGAGALYHGRVTVVDYPSPNTAKQMHVGHLRVLVIGEAVQRILRFCGAKIIRDNHIGDWGTNFGTLIMAIKRSGKRINELGDEALAAIEALYKEGTRLEMEDPALRDVSRNELVKLQQGDPENTAIWGHIVSISNQSFQQIYDRLGLEFDYTLGESFYRDKVDRIYQELTECGLAEESQGALAVFHPEHPRFKEQPFLIRKKDGASNYATTDLATLLYRTEHFKADEIVYVTDHRQQDHFQQLFLTAKKWYESTNRVLPELHHVWFGTILGEDGKAIKTKSGESIKLRNLLDEAEQRAFTLVTEKNPDLPESERRSIAAAVGIGAVRYADLSQNRTGDYVFAWDKLLSLDGNTAPYLLYAVARIHSIFRKLDDPDSALESTASPLETSGEIALARKLLAFVDVIQQTAETLRPHVLCTYLYELAGAFSTFYNADKVLVDDESVRARRLLLCRRTQTILETGLHVLGIQTLERM